MPRWNHTRGSAARVVLTSSRGECESIAAQESQLVSTDLRAPRPVQLRRIDDQRYRPVVQQLDPHVGAEAAAGGTYAQRLERRRERLDHRLGELRPRGVAP